jgi:hypothetical protein
MKKIILTVFLISSFFVNAQEYWATYLPNTSSWSNYYESLDGNIYHFDTTGSSPNVVKIDPTESGGHDYKGMDEYLMTVGGQIPSNTLLL